MSTIHSLRDIHKWMAEENTTTLPDYPLEEIEWDDDFFYEPDAGRNLLLRESTDYPYPVYLRARMKSSGQITLWCHGPSGIKSLTQRYLPLDTQLFIPRRLSPLNEPVLLASIPTLDFPVVQTSILHTFPQEIFLNICSKLRLNDLIDLSQTCRSFLSIISHEQLLWHSKLKETQHPLGTNGKEFDVTINYFSESVKYVEDITTSPTCCRGCLDPSASNRTFVGKVGPRLLCDTCLQTQYPKSIPFYLPVPDRHTKIPDWGFYVISWYRYKRLVPGMTFHSYFTCDHLQTLVSNGKFRAPDYYAKNTGLLPFHFRPVDKNVKPVGRVEFEGGDRFAKFDKWNRKLEWEEEPSRKDEVHIMKASDWGVHFARYPGDNNQDQQYENPGAN
ncbi:hypothetical protein TWF506_003989 [Arthrobotrys conoides]|uniref:F-box domain-containing protein n=1 Tax=Arthrobotrys conoides TaxID=74498 RepID=A0AAN8NAR6_9PEZI